MTRKQSEIIMTLV